jgi:predicted acyl esterase
MLHIKKIDLKIIKIKDVSSNKLEKKMKTRLPFIAFIAMLFTIECYSYTTETVYIEMRDGTQLLTRIFKPSDQSDFPLPVIMIRSDASTYDSAIPTITDEHRYIYVKQGIRNAILTDTNIARYDAYDAIEWLADQDWCDGQVATWGGSRYGAFSYAAAMANPPSLIVASTTTIFVNWYDYVYPGGCFRKNDIEYFHQSELYDFKQHYDYSEWWDSYNMITYLDTLNTPIFHFGGWYDLFAPAQLEAFYHLQYFGGEGARGNQKVLIGPQQHTKPFSNESGQITFPENASYDRNGIRYAWFDYWMKDQKDNMMANYPNVSLYLMGPVEESGHWNEWLTFDEWPFADTDTLRFYPSENGMLSLEIPSEGSENFIFDPNDPIPTVGGNNGFYSLGSQEGPYDQISVWN